MITQDMQTLIFKTMIPLIQKKGANNKMISVLDIHDALKADNPELSKPLIEAILDVLIQHRYVRYYRDTRKYTYYGITQLGWARWTLKTAKALAQQAQTHSETASHTEDTHKPHKITKYTLRKEK